MPLHHPLHEQKPEARRGALLLHPFGAQPAHARRRPPRQIRLLARVRGVRYTLRRQRAGEGMRETQRRVPRHVLVRDHRQAGAARRQPPPVPPRHQESGVYPEKLQLLSTPMLQRRPDLRVGTPFFLFSMASGYREASAVSASICRFSESSESKRRSSRRWRRNSSVSSLP